MNQENLENRIKSATRIISNQKFQSSPIFEKKAKTQKPKTQIRVKGIEPTMETLGFKKTHSQKAKRKDQQNESIKDDDKHFRKTEFPGIIPSVREVSGGWNTQSNEVIERRHKERQKKLVKERIESSSNDVTNSTVSSGTSDSYTTAAQDSYELRAFNNKENTSRDIIENDLQRYKKNALIKGLLQDEANSYEDKDESSTGCSSDFMDASTAMSDLQSDMQNISIQNEEQAMFQDRMCLFFQSREDEDVYCHPLREQVQQNPEWQQYRLKRKGTETIQTARQYYMNVDDEGFTFSKKK